MRDGDNGVQGVLDIPVAINKDDCKLGDSGLLLRYAVVSIRFADNGFDDGNMNGSTFFVEVPAHSLSEKNNWYELK